MVEELILAGADIIKVGIGPGDHSLITQPDLKNLPTNMFIGIYE